MQAFGDGHSFSGQGLIADSGRHQGGAAERGVSPFLELALGGGCLLLFS